MHPARSARGHARLLLCLLLCLVAGCEGRHRNGATSGVQTAAVETAPPGRRWFQLREDGVHDPEAPGLRFLQPPGEALAELPEANEGNQVNWVAALGEHKIMPRAKIDPQFDVRILDLDILMTRTAGVPMVKFPHRQHTEWLDCSNCHDRIFKAKKGANPVNMLAILQGEFCGQCHGAVSFPLTQCRRCHSVPRDPQGAS
jgi:c(7)-type cytochrome triheme protein